MSAATTIPALLEAGAAESPAIRAPERASLTYAGLRALAERTSWSPKTKASSPSDLTH